MMYRVIIPFTDAQDNDYTYGTNDIYPRNGYTPSKSRIKELLNGTNKRNKPLIVEDDTTEEITNDDTDNIMKSDDNDGGYDF